MFGAIRKRKERKLCEAAYAGELDRVRALLDSGVNPMSVDGDGDSALANGIHYPEIASLLLAAGADPNHRAKDGRTPLMCAGKHGSTENVRLLLDAGADVDACDSDGETALMEACYWGSYRAAGVLLERGADARIAEERGLTALCKLLWNAGSHTRFDAMVDAGVAAGKQGEELFEWVESGDAARATENRELSIDDEFIELLKKLMEAGSPTNASAGGRSASPLFYAVQSGLPIAVLSLLLDAGASPVGDGPAMSEAAQREDARLLELLLAHGGTVPPAEDDDS